MNPPVVEAHFAQVSAFIWLAGTLAVAFLTLGGIWLKLLHTKMIKYESVQTKQLERQATVEAQIANFSGWLKRIEEKLDGLINRELDA